MYIRLWQGCRRPHLPVFSTVKRDIPLVGCTNRLHTKMVCAPAALAAAVFCVNSAAAAESPRVQAGMVVGQLRVAPASGRNAMIGIGNDPDQFQIGIDGSGNFIIASPRTTILSVDNGDSMRIHANLSTRCVTDRAPTNAT